MDNIQILKYKNVNPNNLFITDFDIKYNLDDFYIQSPIFCKYELLNYNSKKYIELKFDDTKTSHIKFLNLVDSIELKIKNYNNKSIKTQIITNIQNKKSLKVKILDNTTIFDVNKNKIENLYGNKISLLLKLEFYNTYYSWITIQILELK
jgi:exosome complex RNA-binding protein Rrp4